MSAFLLAPAPAQAWWETGHQVTARIAAYHLMPAARTRVAQLLEVENTPEAVADALAAASLWADQVKAETQTGNWHFIDLTLQDGRDEMASRCANDDCVTARIRLFAGQLKANDTDADSRWSDQDALRFLVHFVGDIHQPLHASSNADQGGNCEQLSEPLGAAKNLHALWDGPLVDSLADADEKALSASLESEIAAMAPDQQGSFMGGDEQDWAWEAHRLAVVNIYKRLEIPKQDVIFSSSCGEAPSGVTGLRLAIDAGYAADMEPIVKQQLIRGGLRLAKLLNDVLAG